MTTSSTLLFVMLGVACGLLLFGPRIKAMVKSIREKIKNRKNKNSHEKDDDHHADLK